MLFNRLRKVVRPPVLLVGRLLRQGDRLRLDHRPIRHVVPLERVASRVVVFASKAILRVVWTSTLFRLHVHLVQLVRVRLAWNDPSTIAGLLQLAGSGDDESTLFASVH